MLNFFNNEVKILVSAWGIVPKISLGGADLEFFLTGGPNSLTAKFLKKCRPP